MQDFYLRMLYVAYENKEYYFLTCYLHPEYAYEVIEFSGLDASNLTYENAKVTKRDSKGARSLAARSIRIAFEELIEYSSTPIERRNIDRSLIPEIDKAKETIADCFKNNAPSRVDYEWITLVDSDKSSDIKEKEIQKLIEKDNFSKRKEEKSGLLNSFKEIMEEYEKKFSRRYLQSVK